jgi:hypothetical protein
MIGFCDCRSMMDGVFDACLEVLKGGLSGCSWRAGECGRGWYVVKCTLTSLVEL